MYVHFTEMGRDDMGDEFAITHFRGASLPLILCKSHWPFTSISLVLRFSKVGIYHGNVKRKGQIPSSIV